MLGWGLVVAGIAIVVAAILVVGWALQKTEPPERMK